MVSCLKMEKKILERDNSKLRAELRYAVEAIGRVPVEFHHVLMTGRGRESYELEGVEEYKLMQANILVDVHKAMPAVERPLDHGTERNCDCLVD